MLRVGVNLFWLAFLADGLVSLADEMFLLSAGSSLFGFARSLLAFLVVLASVVLAVAMACTPRAPKRLLAPMILYCWWAGPGAAFPLAGWHVPHLSAWLAAGQILAALGVVVALRPWAGGVAFPWTPDPARRRFSWRYSLIAAPVVMGAAFLFASVSLLTGLATEIESISGGYVRVRTDGIYLIERQFKSGPREVRLTGMMHIAEGDFYSEVLPKADPTVPSVVLVEGVTDNQGLLSRDSLHYSRVARLLRVTSQEESEFTAHVVNGLREEKEKRREAKAAARKSHVVTAEKPHEPAAETVMDFRHADVDIETFHPTTIAFLVTVVGILQSDDLRGVVRTLADPHSPLSDENAQQLVMRDILHSRNEKLQEEIAESLKKYRRVIVPWGALHLPEIESWLRSQHFVQSGEVERKALGFW